MEILDKIFTVLENNVLFISLGSLMICLVLTILLIITMTRYHRLSERMRFFMRDSNGDSMEETLREVLEDNREMKIRLKNNTDELVKLNENLLTAIRKTGVVKYNAFPGMAGKVSSSIALLTNENNGVVINCMHGPEGCYTYVKEIMNAKSLNPLTKEDEEALKIALQMQI